MLHWLASGGHTGRIVRLPDQSVAFFILFFFARWSPLQCVCKCVMWLGGMSKPLCVAEQFTQWIHCRKRLAALGSDIDADVHQCKCAWSGKLCWGREVWILFVFNCCLKTFTAVLIPVMSRELDKGWDNILCWLSVDLFIIFPDNWCFVYNTSIQWSIYNHIKRKTANPHILEALCLVLNAINHQNCWLFSAGDWASGLLMHNMHHIRRCGHQEASGGPPLQPNIHQSRQSLIYSHAPYKPHVWNVHTTRRYESSTMCLLT